MLILIFLLIFLQDAAIDQSEVFHRVVSSVCILLTKDEVIFFIVCSFLSFGEKRYTRRFFLGIVIGRSLFSL